MNFDAVIFDLDDVLCHLDDRARIATLQTLTGKSPEELRQAIWGSGFETRADEGEFTADEYLQRFGEQIGTPIALDQWVNYRRSGMTPIPESLEIAQQVALKAKVAILSNNGPLLKQEIDRLFPELRPIFKDQIFVSSEFKTQKPAPEIYRQLCKILEVDPGKTAFTDDREENVRGAREAGLQAHHFQNPEGLRRFLADDPS
jgi:glucose-1-phosphatase